tara:strand:- start:327 stop:629 length:303 start_codon:yes stop_codon:yes gene_type:complete
MSKPSKANWITVFLNQSPRTDRYYFTAQSFTEQTVKDLQGNDFIALSPKGNNDLRNLPDDAIKSSILPEEWNSKTMDEVVAMVGKTAQLDTVSGSLKLTS